MGRETAYDNVFHAQSHFRSVLDSMSRPGIINALEPVAVDPPPLLNRASALVAMALVNANVSFALLNMTEHEAAYLTLNTRARVAALEQASFVFADGQESPDALEDINCGTLTYPDTSATLVVQVQDLAASLPSGPASGSPCLRLALQGPGIDGTAAVYVRGLSPDLLLALQARNMEFPLGIDAILTCDHGGRPRVLGLARTTRVSWDAC